MDWSTIITIIIVIVIIGGLAIGGYYLFSNVFGGIGQAISDFLGEVGLGNIMKVCPDGQFQHMATGLCYSCPEDYARSLNPDIEAGDACVYKGGCIGKYGKGAFEHWGTGQCYSCPEDYARSLNPDIEAPDACIYRGGCKAKYTPSSFEHQFSGECYDCGEDYNRSLNPDINAPDACIYKGKCQGKYGPNAFEHWFGGECYSCPEDMARTINPDPLAVNACQDFRGCQGRYGKDAFEHWLSGECYKCKPDWIRSLNPEPGADDACVYKGGCKGLYGEYAFQHGLTGDCFSCEPGYYRTGEDIYSSKACALQPIAGKDECQERGAYRIDSLNKDYPLGCYKCPTYYQMKIGQFDPAVACKFSATGGEDAIDWYEPIKFLQPVPSRCALSEMTRPVIDSPKGGVSTCWKCKSGFKPTDEILPRFPNLCYDPDVKGLPETTEATLVSKLDKWKSATSEGRMKEPAEHVGTVTSPANHEGSIWKSATPKGSIWDEATWVGGDIQMPATYEGEAVYPGELEGAEKNNGLEPFQLHAYGY